MVNEAAAFKQADEVALERLAARTKLEAYLFECRKLLRDKELRGRIEDEDLDTIMSALDTTDAWIDASEEASVLEYEQRHGELVEVSVGPLLAKYGAEPGAPGEGGGGFGDGFDDEINLGEHDEL